MIETDSLFKLRGQMSSKDDSNSPDSPEIMKVTIVDRGLQLRERLRERLARAADLRCAEHGKAVVAVTINARENGWFDSRFTTCCDRLMKDAAAIVKDRC